MNASKVSPAKESFFTHDRKFYEVFFPLLVGLVFQNLIAYSVNMADNIMLGSYSQNALSGASVVNQVFFIVQQLTLCLGDCLVMLGTQYWGQKRTEPIKKLIGIALCAGLFFGFIILGVCTFLKTPLLGIFTTSEGILYEADCYIRIVKYSFLFFFVTNILMAALRCVQVVKISFYISLLSLVINVGINYTLIFGNFGFPEMGVRGAAIGTVTARIAELVAMVVYISRDKRLQLKLKDLLKPDKTLAGDYSRALVPVIIGRITWAVMTPLQTVILGHLSEDAIAANSVATTFYQYLKMVVTAMGSASAIMIGNVIGRGDRTALRQEARTLSTLDVGIGIIMAALLMLLRGPLLSLYHLTDTAMVLADQLMIIMSFVMIGMSYQMPVGSGILRGGGDAKFTAITNNVSVWCIVVPLSLLSAFVWKWPVPWVVLCLQSDQILKGIPVFFRFRSYKWAKKLTRDQV